MFDRTKHAIATASEPTLLFLPTVPQAQSARVQGAVTAIQRARPGRFVRKFGPLILIITLLFAVKYLLLAIHLNVRSMKSDVLAQCNNGGGGNDTGSGDNEERANAYGHMEGMKNEAWRQHRMVGRGTYGYVQWSAYRVHDSMVVAVGLGSTQLRNHRKVMSSVQCLYGSVRQCGAG